ncbi:archaellin/type IV pilin N-terminal domain-containing protein [Halorientalis regularis]|uniref:Flagellin n=1 Tax=Halorientalis regularis TaxID=660518 RepID=A0A1G7L8N0_9EURY|nr:flagellin N-terminal-like domain-containing protein [Halorientalis regularis]
MALRHPGSRRPNRGQVGIGTLIVFIAMILVAGMAGGVLLSTTEFLQSQSEETGEAASAQVSDRVTFISKYGTVAEANDRIILKSSQVHYLDFLTENSLVQEELIIPSGREVEVFSQGGGGGGCSPPYHLIINGVRSDEPLPFDDRLKFEKTSEDNIRVTHIDADGSNYVITTASSPLSAKVDAASDCTAELEFREIGGDDSRWFVDEQRPAEIRSAKESLSRVSVTVRSAPGAGDIDLSNAVVTYVSSSTVQHFTYTKASANKTRFTTEPLQDNNVVLEDDEQVTLHLNMAAVESGLGLKPGAKVKINLNTERGTVTTVTLTVPESFSRAEPLL